jgi:hypothetical protein
MTTLTLPFPSGRGTGRKGVIRFLCGLADGIRDGLALAARYDRLVCMSDAELARLGLRREDIARAALSSGRRR